MENNNVKLIGNVISDKKFSYEENGEKYYIFDLEVQRLSGDEDVISIMASERILTNDYQIGTKIMVEAQFQSYNKYENGKNKLVLITLAENVRFAAEVDAETNPNEIILRGSLCKKPIYRTTPFGREVSDILLAVDRNDEKSDYIPCIAWGRNARYTTDFEVGKEIKIWGRIQSREYTKKFEDGTSEIRRAYEVSISKMETED